MFTNFAIFKNTRKKEGSNQPDYTISIREEEGEKSIEAGAVWLKDYNGTKFFSCSLREENSNYQTKDGEHVELPAYVILRKDKYEDLMRIAGKEKQTPAEKAGVTQPTDEELADPSNIPF